MTYQQGGYQDAPQQQSAQQASAQGGQFQHCVGTVEAISEKNRQQPYSTQHGLRWNLTMKIGGAWYKLPFCDPNEATPVQRGATVEFDYEIKDVNGRTYLDIIKKTFVIQGHQPPPDQSQSPMNQPPYQPPQQQAPAQQQGGYQQPAPDRPTPPPRKNSQDNCGITVGHALTNAVALCGQGTDLATLEGVAWGIISLGDHMNQMLEAGQYGEAKCAPTPTQPSAPQPPEPSAPAAQQEEPTQQQPTYPQEPKTVEGGALPSGFSNPAQ